MLTLVDVILNDVICLSMFIELSTANLSPKEQIQIAVKILYTTIHIHEALI